MKHLEILGPDAKLGDIQEVRCLNRLIRYIQSLGQPDEKAYLEWEADPRHVEILLAQMSLHESSKSLSTLGEKMPKGADC